MNIKHKVLASGRWNQLSFLEQMANIGSEVSRALNWRKKDNPEYCQKAIIRALELLSLTLDKPSIPSHYKELTRLKEAIIDYFYGKNEFSSTEMSWRNYFDHFNYAVRKNY